MRNNGKRLAIGLAFLAPNILGFCAFTLIPLAFSLVLAFSNWDLRRHNMFHHEPIRMIGFGNFVRLFRQPDFWRFFGNTLFLMLAIPFSIGGSLCLALLLSRDVKRNISRAWAGLIVLSVLLGSAGILVLCGVPTAGMAMLLTAVGGGILLLGTTAGSTAYRTFLYLPSFTSGVAVFILWKKLYAANTGPINHALSPALDLLTRIVNHTPAMLWTVSGMALWIVGAGACIALLLATIRKVAAGDVGTLAAISAFLAVLVLGLACLGLGWVLHQLPSRAAVGLTPPNWLSDFYWAKPALIIMTFWASVGSNNMLLYLAGLSGIPPELYEAAQIDGAGRWQQLVNITWPQLAPTTFFIVVMSMIGGLQGGFEMARSMTQGGPAGATTTLSYFIYSEGFETGRLGFSSAVAWVLSLLVLIITLFNWKVGSRYVNE